MRRTLTLLSTVIALVAAGCGGGDQVAKRRAPSSSPSASGAATPTPPDSVSPQVLARAVRNYYRALDRNEFGAAWSRLSPRLRRKLGGYDAWKAGYGTTVSITPRNLSATPEGTARGTVDVDLRAVDTDACGRTARQRFAGSWTLTRRGGRWVAADIKMSRVGGAARAVKVSACATPTPTPPAEESAGTTSDDAPGAGDSSTEVCYPAVHLPEVRLPAVDIPPVTLPAFTLNGHRYPARRLAGQHIPGSTIPGQTLKGGCFDAPESFAPSHTTVRVSGYDRLDPNFSDQLSTRYWSDTDASTPDPTAAGFGEFNAAGYPRNQYVRPYVRRDGTMVSGYWRNSPSDGLPTCRVTSC